MATSDLNSPQARLNKVWRINVALNQALDQMRARSLARKLLLNQIEQIMNNGSAYNATGQVRELLHENKELL